jgi:hypothetical protein
MPTDDEIRAWMTDAIVRARQTFPQTGQGTTHDDIFTSVEDASLFARAALEALKKRGLKVVVEGDDAKGT